MKFLPLFLLGSLAVNAAFVTLYFVRFPSGTSAPAAATSATNKTAAKTAPSPSAEISAAETAALAQVRTHLQNGDLATLVARLRAAGFSASMIRTIVAAQVNEQFTARRKELLGAQEDRPFWKGQQNLFDPKVQAGLRALGKEQSDLLKSLLGADYMQGGEEMRAAQRRQYGNLPAEKLAQLQSINADYGELSQEIYAKSKGMMLAEDREKIAFLEKEKLADIAKTLTPQELEEFQFRTSPTANQLRGKLANFEVNEAEFRAIYKLQAAFDAQYSIRDGVPSPDKMATRVEAEKQLQAAILASLPPERGAEYKLTTDPQYQQVNRLVARLELPPATTQQVVSVQQDIQARATTLRTDRTLTPDARTAQLTALQEEATTKLTTALTPRGLEAYKQNGGAWLQGLQPRPASAPAASASGTVQLGISLRPRG